jgi:hypothetical protein
MTRFVEHFITSIAPKPFPMDRFPNLHELCIAVLKRFSKKSLLLGCADRRAPKAVAQPVEALFQDEFYHAFKSLLGNGVGISSEWQRGVGGRIDFRILDPKWGVEFLSEGTAKTLEEHYKRFEPDGQYHWWISNDWIRDWVVIDCRSSPPRAYGKFTSLLYLWVTPLIVISATTVASAESVACCV